MRLPRCSIESPDSLCSAPRPFFWGFVMLKRTYRYGRPNRSAASLGLLLSAGLLPSAAMAQANDAGVDGENDPSIVVTGQRTMATQLASEAIVFGNNVQIVE